MSAVAIAGAVLLAPSAHAAPADSAQLMVVQALPGQVLDVDLGTRSLADGSKTGSVLGPFSVPAGQHQVIFRDASGDVVVNTTVDLTAGASQDLVVHLPAEVEGAPVATLFTTPTTPISAEKSRVMIAHTASVAPADVRLDGRVVFSNIANGEFATADVAAGAHVAELLPAGLTTRTILGPLDVKLPASTATMVYAVGNTQNDSMKAISHSIALGANGADAPTTIDAGSVGLASGIDITTFSDVGSVSGDRGSSPAPIAPYLAALAGLFALAFATVHGRRQRTKVAASQ